MLFAFGVGDHRRIGVGRFQAQEGFFAEGFMHHAAARPQRELTTRLAGDPAAQVLIGSKQDRLIARHRLHHRHGVAAGADQIALGFDRC